MTNQGLQSAQRADLVFGHFLPMLVTGYATEDTIGPENRRPTLYPSRLTCGAIRIHVRIARHTERHPPWSCQLAETSGMAHGHSGRESDGTNEGLAGRHGGDGRTPTRRATRIAQEEQFGRTEAIPTYRSIYLSVSSFIS